MIIAGIDPGKRGALVVLDISKKTGWFEKLKYDDGGYLITRLADKIKGIDRLLIEKIHGRGGWGASSVFSMGFYFGQLIHEVVKTRKQFDFVEPSVWCNVLHRNMGKGTGKEKSLRAYHSIFPNDPIGTTKGKSGYHDGIIDALLIAVYETIRDNKHKIPTFTINEF